MNEYTQKVKKIVESLKVKAYYMQKDLEKIEKTLEEENNNGNENNRQAYGDKSTEFQDGNV